MIPFPVIAPCFPHNADLIEDFQTRSAGSLVGQGWSALDGTTAVNFTVESSADSLYGRRLLIDKTTSDGTRRITFDAVGTVGDVEVLARIKFTETVTFDNGQVNIRANSGNSGVFCVVNGTGFSGSSDDNVFVIYRITGAGTASEIARASFTHAVGTWYWVRLRASGTTFSASIWEYGASEPSFMASGTDAGAPATGQVGMGCFEADANYVCDFFSAALGGATAPFP